MSTNELIHAESPAAQRKISSPVIDANQLISELKSAIEEKRFEVYYQPQFDSRTNSFAHLEALIRWNHHTMGSIAPSIFIPIAEQCELIDSLTELVIEQVAEDLKNCFSGETKLEIAINISARQLSDQESVAKLLRKIELLSDFAESIILELTETSVVQNKKLAKEFLDSVRNHGFRIALDDFGTGHSSLQHLLEFPVDFLKIDRFFVQNLAESEKSRKIIAGLVALSQSLDIEVIAEGVETQQELLLLTKLGCYRFQGYFFSKALPKWQIKKFLSARAMSA